MAHRSRGPMRRAVFDHVLAFFLGLLLPTLCLRSAQAKPPPKSINQLRAPTPPPTLVRERALEGGDEFSAYLVSYNSAGLKVNALIAVPRSEPPKGGFPVVVASHGTHPNPARYGFSEAGVDSRPGDYYRPVPALFTARGFIVVMPDFRGHNTSEGAEYVGGFLSPAYYAEDVVALLSAIPQITNADARNVFLWGHSMGGEVTLRALLAVPSIRAASLWSTAFGDIWERAAYYEKRGNPGAVTKLRADIDALGAVFDPKSITIDGRPKDLRVPINIHHAIEDQATLMAWAEALAENLSASGATVNFYRYPGDDHFFDGEVRDRAADRDADLFRSAIIDSAVAREDHHGP